MYRPFLPSLAAAFACAALAGARTPQQPPKPGPEIRRLGYFIGTWHEEGDLKASMLGPADHVRSTARIEWMPGNMFYIAHNTQQTSAGVVNDASIAGWDRDKKVYAAYAFDPHGDMRRIEGTLTRAAGSSSPAGGGHAGGASTDDAWAPGDTWRWTTQWGADADLVKLRETVKVTSATAYDFTWEIAAQGKDFQTILQGKATKTPQ